MAGDNRVEGILSRLDDLSSRLASDKSVKDLSEGLKSMERGLDAKIEAVVAGHFKTMGNRITELEETIRKEVKKLRDEVTELVEGLSPGEESETTKSVMAEVKPLIGELKGILDFGKSIMGEKDVREVVKSRVKSWLGKKIVSGEEGE